MGIHEALSWVKKKECTNVMIEMDCLSLVQAIRCASTNLSFLGRLINDRKSLMTSLKEQNVILR